MGLPTNDYLRIISKSYGPRKPLVVCEASSLDMLADLDCAEGSTATVGGTEYVLDRVNGWIEPGSGGGGGGSGVLVVNITSDETTHVSVADKTAGEIKSAALSGGVVASFGGDAVMSLVSYAPYGTEGAVCFCFAAGDEEQTQLFASFFYAESDSDYPSTETPK